MIILKCSIFTKCNYRMKALFWASSPTCMASKLINVNLADYNLHIKLLPTFFVWLQSSISETSFILHSHPSPNSPSKFSSRAFFCGHPDHSCLSSCSLHLLSSLTASNSSFCNNGNTLYLLCTIWWSLAICR